MTIKKRRNIYINNNMSLCDNKCIFKNYNDSTKKVLCECNIFNIDKLLNSFKKLKNALNLNIMKCYYILFNKEVLKKNIGFYFICIILMLTITLSILFKLKGYDKLKALINEIVKNKKINIKDKKMINRNNPPLYKEKKHKINIMKTNNEILNKSNSKNELKITFNIIDNKRKKKKEKKKKIISIKNKSIIKGEDILANNNKLNNKKVINLNDSEINNLKYQDALLLDKRNYFQFYCSLLKINHLIIFTFYTKNDYNSRIIKYILFLFSFVLYYLINALFFNEDVMDQIYEDEDVFNFVYQLPQIIYSSLISSFIIILLKYLSLSEINILELKKTNKNIIEKTSKILKCLLIKLILFFILIFIFIILSWYYLSCFCAVYRNIQYHLLKDTLISFGLSLTYPFIISLLPGLLRIPSLKNKNRQLLYKISKILQII